jgi:integrase/recombinase XerC
VDALFEYYLAALERRRVSPLTIKANRHALSLFQRWLAAKRRDADAACVDDCEQYLDERLETHAVATVRRDLAMIRGAYRHAQRRGLIASDPTLGIRLPPLPDRDTVIYDPDELRAIHAAIRDEREQMIFFLLAFAGLRLCEATSLAWSNVELADAQLRFVGKGGKRRVVPLHPALERHLTAQGQRHPSTAVVTTVSGRPLAHRTWGTIVSRLVSHADVHVAQPSHAFRRTVASELYANGIRTHVIDRLLGWAPRTVRDRHYIRVADQAMRDAITTLYQRSPICPEQAPVREPSALVSRDVLVNDLLRLTQLEAALVDSRTPA